MTGSGVPGRLTAAALLLSAWLGAALLAVAVVAPGAFAVLPSRTLAGDMVGRVLPALFVAGIAAAAAVMVLAGSPIALGGARAAPRSAGWMAFLCALGCVISQFVITPKLDRIRAGIEGPVDSLPVGDARRVAFGVLHGYNVAGLGMAIAAAAVCLCILVLALRQRS
jgi:hypothetical protein